MNEETVYDVRNVIIKEENGKCVLIENTPRHKSQYK